jgi:hypothetical protein
MLKEIKDKESFSPSSILKKVGMKYSLLPFRKISQSGMVASLTGLPAMYLVGFRALSLLKF